MQSYTHQTTAPETRYLRERQVLEIIPISHTTLWRWVAIGAFPKPHKIGPNVTAWRIEDVRARLAQISAEEAA